MTLQIHDRLYKSIVIVTLWSIAVFGFASVAIYAYDRVMDDGSYEPLPPPGSQPLPVFGLGSLRRYDFDLLRQVYYYLDDGEIIWLLLETWNVPRVCGEDGLSHEIPISGLYVNVEPAGYRRGYEPAPWPPSDDDFTIFVFGSSATFGYGVSDNLTIPANLQFYLREELGTERITVYNFGRAVFLSSQERIFFEQLVNDGFTPDMAIFIDGLVDFSAGDGQPRGRCEDALTASDRFNNTLQCDSDELCLPVQDVAFDLIDYFKKEEATPAPRENDVAPAPDDEAFNAAIIERWVTNKSQLDAFAQEHGIETVYVMQPIPSYAYDLRNHLFINSIEELASERAFWGYAMWEARYESEQWSENVINLTHLGEDNEGPIYVDSVHYSFGFMEEIAQAMTTWLLERYELAP